MKISGSKLFWEWSFIGSWVIIFVVIGNGLNINIVYGNLWVVVIVLSDWCFVVNDGWLKFKYCDLKIVGWLYVNIY